ncbi:FxsA family protein [Myxococcota bacterium]|nr:FxsA family protein [Myxococcota bacterium]MBU1432644.1 FxsA family protein [Myxococcota bacterium]MBU1897434.1 FxsA family protein [Myxococcota bacterium]
MCGLLLVLFFMLPTLEVLLLIEVGHALGAAPTFLLILLTAVAGAQAAKAQSLASMRQLQQEIALGQLPATVEILDRPLLLLAAIALFFPGLITDALGALLLIPPLRRAVARAIIARFSGPRGGDGPRVIVIRP